MPADKMSSARTVIDTPLGRRAIYRLDAVKHLGHVDRIPYCIKVLLESALRRLDGFVVTEQTVKALAAYDAQRAGESEIPFMPGRVVLQDFTGVPSVVDLAAMRSAMIRMGADPSAVNPLVPCDLVIDHSVQVDAFNSGEALSINSRMEFERNRERYQLLKWAQQAFDDFRVVPPATGIVHQVNLEYLAKVVWQSDAGTDGAEVPVLHPDSLVGTDSHTTMINGLGVVGWGVGGIEAEAVMLGQPITMLIPQVVGMKLTGALAQGATATDLVLRVTQVLRELGVVGKFVEFLGPGLDRMPLANRATIANMAPEYGATIGYFPVDSQTLRYLRLTGRDETLVETVEQYCKLQGMWRDDDHDIVYSDVIELDLSTIEPALAGPKRPQDRILLRNMKTQWQRDLADTFNKTAVASRRADGATTTATAVADADTYDEGEGVPVTYDGEQFVLRHGAVCIAAITSCTNTSNPQVMVGAGLVARKARELGLSRKPWVKTSLAPGSKVVTDYLERAGLMEDLQALGFHLVGYGCTTCIGNSGPLPEPVHDAVIEGDLIACAVLSGNRNFEGRINPDIKANYLASPPLVVAFAIAGTVNIDLARDPIGVDRDGNQVTLKDLWPTQAQIEQVIGDCVDREQFLKQYANVFEGSPTWQSITTSRGALYQWDETSTYIQEPPFFTDLSPQPQALRPIVAARCLAHLGDSVTTDHISPAGAIKEDSPAGRYLIDRGVRAAMFNSYGSRRGNDRVMIRGTFANVRVRNKLAPGKEGGWTTDFTTGKLTSIHEAASSYRSAGVPLIVLAGSDYGRGSSRDWAAKGTFLLGVRAVIARSFERIHRSNLVGMGVLPLCYADDQSAESLGLDGTETFDVQIDDELKPGQDVAVTATRQDGTKIEFTTTCRIDTPVEVDYYRNGGILHTVLRKMAVS